jgi:plastocyanin
MRLLVGPAAAVLVLVFATACGGGGGTAATPGQTAASSTGVGSFAIPTQPPSTAGAAGAPTKCDQAAASGGAVISMEGTHSLNPADESIKAGDSVTWTNNSQTNHHIKFNGGPDCGFTLINKSVSVKFDNAGSFSYFCTIHPTFMKGTITVQ